MSTTGSSIKFSEYGTRFFDEGAKALKSYGATIERASKEGVEIKQIPGRVVDFAKKDGVDYVKQVVQTSLDYYLALMSAGVTVSTALADAVLTPKSKTAAKK